MGQENCDGYALVLYHTALRNPCLLPDVGIDESLLKYSGMDSNAVLQTFSNDMVNNVPAYIERLGTALAPMTHFPNAVGLGALVISMIIEICIKSTTQTADETYSMVRRVFGEEKASAVRDTMSEYLRRHHTFIGNDQRLQEELRRLEQQLSNQLTILRNSLLHDEQMNTRGLKIWVNGAHFHLQMLLHEARLNNQTRRRSSDYVNAIRAATNLYLQDLETLLNNYRTKIQIRLYEERGCVGLVCRPPMCSIKSAECQAHVGLQRYPCSSDMSERFLNVFFSKYEPITGLKSHFLNIKNNLNSLINQRGSFSLPSKT